MSVYDPTERDLYVQRLDKICEAMEAEKRGDVATAARIKDEIESEDAWVRVIKDCRPFLRLIGYALIAYIAWSAFNDF